MLFIFVQNLAKLVTCITTFSFCREAVGPDTAVVGQLNGVRHAVVLIAGSYQAHKAQSFFLARMHEGYCSYLVCVCVYVSVTASASGYI